MRRKYYALVVLPITLILLFTVYATSDRITLTWRKILHESTDIGGPYKAPMHACDLPDEEIVYNSYIVFLHRGYSLDQHSQAIGFDVESLIEHRFPETKRHGVYYGATLNKDVLAIVRADTGVDMVECNVKVHLIE